jgi:hypothetical protein
LYVAGGPLGVGCICDDDTGALLDQFDLGAGFFNDVIVTRGLLHQLVRPSASDSQRLPTEEPQVRTYFMEIRAGHRRGCTEHGLQTDSPA